MAITNISKPSSSVSNQSKINIGEVWNTDLNQWQNETRTWNDMASIIGNSTKIYSGFLWVASTLPWQLATPWIDTNKITNISRP